MSTASGGSTVDGLKQTAEQTLDAREEFGRSRESWEQRRQFESRLADYLVEEAGCDVEHAEQQASEIALDAVIGDIEDAKQKIEAVDAMEEIEMQQMAEQVKQAALEFYHVQKRHDRSSETYRDARENLEDQAEEYLETGFGMEENSFRHARRIATEVALGGGHIYDALAKVDAIENLRTDYAEEN